MLLQHPLSAFQETLYYSCKRKVGQAQRLEAGGSEIGRGKESKESRWGRGYQVIPVTSRQYDFGNKVCSVH